MAKRWTFRVEDHKHPDPRMREMVKLTPEERRHFKRVGLLCAAVALFFLGISGGWSFYEYFKFKDGDVVAAEVTDIRSSGSSRGSGRRYRVTLQAMYKGESISKTVSIGRSGVTVGGVSVSASRLSAGDEMEVLVAATDEGYDMAVRDDALNPWPEFAWGLIGGSMFALVAYFQLRVLRQREVRLGSLPEKYRLSRLANRK